MYSFVRFDSRRRPDRIRGYHRRRRADADPFRARGRRRDVPSDGRRRDVPSDGRRRDVPSGSIPRERQTSLDFDPDCSSVTPQRDLPRIAGHGGSSAVTGEVPAPAEKAPEQPLTATERPAAAPQEPARQAAAAAPPEPARQAAITAPERVTPLRRRAPRNGVLQSPWSRRRLVRQPPRKWCAGIRPRNAPPARPCGRCAGSATETETPCRTFR